MSIDLKEGEFYRVINGTYKGSTVELITTGLTRFGLCTWHGEHDACVCKVIQLGTTSEFWECSLEELK